MASKYAEAYKNPKGPGDARPTALQIIQDAGLEGKLGGKTVLVTGCSSGIGISTARAMYATGATCFLTARNIAKAKTALPELVDSDRVHLVELDLNSLDSVRACSKEVLALTTTLNIFIANAGIMATPEGRTKDGFELQLGTNHLAHFLLFNLLKNLLIQAATPELSSRAVFVSSIGHRMGTVNFDNINLEGVYNEWTAYGQSKTALVWTANEIDRRYADKGLRAFSLHPGGIFTNLQQHVPRGAGDMFTGYENVFCSPDQGAATTTWAALSRELEGEGGKYMEDCHVARASTDADGEYGPGYAPWAYDEASEGRLWKKSLKMVGLSE